MKRRFSSGYRVVAGLLKLEELRMQQEHTGLDDSVPLLRLTAIGMDWKSHIAYKNPEDGATMSSFKISCTVHQGYHF